MATSRRTPAKSQPVTQFPASTAVLDGAIPEEFIDSEDTTETETAQAPAPEKPKRGRPPEDKRDFFERVADIPSADWGNKVYIYLYVIEPLVNLRQSGGKTYLNRYSEPVRDEHQIMHEHGSGRYRLLLAKRKKAGETQDELARHEFECYNREYPPKIPREAWVNDSRNKKWEALLPKEATAPAAGAVNLVDAIKTVNDLRRDVREEMEMDIDPPSNSAAETLTLLKTAKELFAPPAAAAAPAPTVQKDPLEIALQLFTLMNTSKAENPVIDMYKMQLELMNKQMESLQKQLIEVKEKEKPKTLVEQIKELAGMGDQLKPLKDMFGLNGDGPVRHGKMNTLEFISSFADTQMGQALGAGLSNLALAFISRPAPGMPPMPGPQMVSPTPQVIQSPPQNGSPGQETANERLARIGQTITRPMLYDFFFAGESGATFAASMCNMFEADYMFLKELGPAHLVNAYRQFPAAWQFIAPKEIEFIRFVEEFCNFDPNSDEGPAPAPGDDGIVDFDTKEEGN